jgi:hypothetical protein
LGIDRFDQHCAVKRDQFQRTLLRSKKNFVEADFLARGSVSNWPAMAKELVNHGESARSTCHQQV